MGNLACLLKVRLTFNQIAVLLQAKPNEFRYFQSKEHRQYAWYISNNTGIFCLFLDAFFYFLVTYITLNRIANAQIEDNYLSITYSICNHI